MAARRHAARTDTRTAVLDAAERMVQERGFNAFSYGDVARELKVTTAALHYHFPGKAELGEALLTRYTQRFGEALSTIDERAGAPLDKLRAYADLYLDVLRDDRMCLCGMLAAEYRTLPQAMQQAMLRFFDDSEVWLTRVLEAGRDDGSIEFSDSAAEAAQMVIGTLEGAMLVARPYGDPSRFESVAEQLIAELATPRVPLPGS
jgi:TetR/AcrR family transcriptional repressor of nem operon